MVNLELILSFIAIILVPAFVIAIVAYMIVQAMYGTNIADKNFGRIVFWSVVSGVIIGVLSFGVILSLEKDTSGDIGQWM